MIQALFGGQGDKALPHRFYNLLESPDSKRTDAQNDILGQKCGQKEAVKARRTGGDSIMDSKHTLFRSLEQDPREAFFFVCVCA